MEINAWIIFDDSNSKLPIQERVYSIETDIDHVNELILDSNLWSKAIVIRV
jgi:hypothetical protein